MAGKVADGCRSLAITWHSVRSKFGSAVERLTNGAGSQETATTDSGIVLVHGAWHGAWCWERVTPLLARQGIQVVEVELPFTGFDDDVGAVRRGVAEIRGKAVVCGHSYGGRVMSSAVVGEPKVVHIVYLAAYMLDNDQLRCFLRQGRLGGRRNFEDYDVETARRYFYADCTDIDVDAATRRLRPMKVRPGPTIGLNVHPWRDVPSTYIVCGQDRCIDPGQQREMAGNARHSAEIDSSHSPFLSEPDVLAEILSSIVSHGQPHSRG